MDSKKGCIGVVPIGEVPEIALHEIATHIKSHLYLHSVILPPIKHPSYAYDERRMQYNAATILKELESMSFQNYDKIIGVLNVDLFIPVFTHVLGEAQEGGKYALASIYRLRRDLDTSSSSTKQIIERVTKIALHEIGHLYNIAHCMNEKCLMHFSGSLQDLDKITLNFCNYCSEYLENTIRRQISPGVE